MIKVLKKIKVSFIIMKVHNLHEKGMYQEALLLLDDLNRKYKDICKKIVDYYLLYAILNYKQGEIKKAIKYFLSTKNAIENLNNYNIDEKKYILIYVLQWLDFLDAKKCIYLNNDIFYKIKNKETIFNINKISKSLIDYFPIDFSREIDIEKLRI